jgi:beta-glucosidase
VQQGLLEKVAALGKPVVLVLTNGSAVAVNWADRHIPAIVEAWYPGGQGGEAVAELLAGDFSPAGRLPVTFYRSVDQLPPFGDYSMRGRTYRYFTGEVPYPFGYGLSYTSFAYDKPRLSARRIKAGESIDISIRVTNTGDMAGDEVVQLYLSHPGIDGAPIRSLQGFKRIALKRGQSETVTFTLDKAELATVDEKGIHRVVPGTVNVWVGGGQPIESERLSPAAGVSASFEITSGLLL